MFCYLILHYKNIKDTFKCIESILKIMKESDSIIVVDNGSNDGSGEKLKKHYFRDNKIVVLVSEKNLGFSKGNNWGYCYIKENFHPDFIVINNNDVVFVQKDFQTRVLNIYNRTKFDVLGPDVFIPTNDEHQNPLFKNGITLNELEHELREYEKYQKNPKSFKRRLKLHKLKGKICSHSSILRVLYNFVRKKENLDYRKEYVDIGLQGSCLIISKKYFLHEDKIFMPEPFLYCEEIFLYYNCKQKNYKMVYSPELCIHHEEAASFKNANKDNHERIVFMLEQHVNARKMLLDYLKTEIE